LRDEREQTLIALGIMLTILYLFVVNLLEMLALPWHLAIFLIRRRAIVDSNRRRLESQWIGRGAW
jgi:hypothetical protein